MNIEYSISREKMQSTSDTQKLLCNYEISSTATGIPNQDPQKPKILIFVKDEDSTLAHVFCLDNPNFLYMERLDRETRVNCRKDEGEYMAFIFDVAGN